MGGSVRHFGGAIWEQPRCHEHKGFYDFGGRKSRISDISHHIGRFVMLAGVIVQITAESSVVIGRLCCNLHFCPDQNDKRSEVRDIWVMKTA